MSDEELTEEELNQIVADLDFAQREYEKLVHLSSPIMPCPECGGAGSVSGGSLGDICPGCLGSRVVNQPGYQKPELELPDFQGIRVKLAAAQASNDARAGRLSDDEKAKVLASGNVPILGIRTEVASILDGIRRKAGELVLAQQPTHAALSAHEVDGDDDDPRLED